MRIRDRPDAVECLADTLQELIAQPAERILGRPAKELDLADCLAGEGTRVLSRTFPGGTGRWGMRRTMFREGGLPLQLGSQGALVAEVQKKLRITADGVFGPQTDAAVRSYQGAMGLEVDRLSVRLQKRQAPGETAAERVSFVLERSTRSLQRDPLLTEAMIRAMMAADATVATEVAAVRSHMHDLIVQAIRGGGEPQEHESEIAAILQDVWFARQIAWLGGRIGAADVWRDIHQAITLVLRD